MTTKGLYIYKSSLTAALVFLTAFLFGCSSDQLPNDLQLSINPANHNIDVVEQRSIDDRCVFDANNHVDLPLVLSLTSGNGSPVGKAPVSVYLDFAGNTFSGVPALALYEDYNNNGVVDAESELVSGAENDIAVVETDRYDGSHQMLIRVNLSCGFRGGVYAVAGASVARSSISVNSTAQEDVVEESLLETSIPFHEAGIRS